MIISCDDIHTAEALKTFLEECEVQSNLAFTDSLDTLQTLVSNKYDVVFILSSTEMESLYKAKDIGAKNILIKPFTRESFDAIVDRTDNL